MIHKEDFKISARDFLLTEHLVTRTELMRTLQTRPKGGDYILKYFVDKHVLSDMRIAEIMSRRYHLPYLTLDNYTFDMSIAKLVPEEMACKYGLIPLDKTGHILTVAFANWPDKELVDLVSKTTSCEVAVTVTSVSELKRNMRRAYRDGISDSGKNAAWDAAKEKRRFKRYSRAVNVTCKIGNGWKTRKSINISCGGLLIKSDIPIEGSPRLFVSLALTAGGKNINIMATVARTEYDSDTAQYSVALEFVTMEDDNMRRLRKYCKSPSSTTEG